MTSPDMNAPLVVGNVSDVKQVRLWPTTPQRHTFRGTLDDCFEHVNKHFLFTLGYDDAKAIAAAFGLAEAEVLVKAPDGEGVEYRHATWHPSERDDDNQQTPGVTFADVAHKLPPLPDGTGLVFTPDYLGDTA